MRAPAVARVNDLDLPSWMDTEAPGAAAAARLLWNEAQSDAQRERLKRLTSESTRRVWRELRRPHKSKKSLSQDEMYNAQLHLLSTAFHAADFLPISGTEIAQRREHLASINAQISLVARHVREVAGDAQLWGLWQQYRRNRSEDRLLAALPDDLVAVAGLLEHIADFFRRASPMFKPAGPVPPVGKLGDEALKTTVIRAIAEECEKWFGTTMHSTVANLANSTLGRTDITRESVRGSLRNAAKRTRV
jgi:hypothetical protein